MYNQSQYPKEKPALYALLCDQVTALCAGVPHTVANLANISALLWDGMKDINWVGFYLLQGDTLILAPFQGKPACIEIPMGRGVCGTAAREDQVQLVYDVHKFPGHIACDGASNSEIVIPLHKNGQVIGVLDIDSPLIGRFDDADREGLIAVAQRIEAIL